jgi:hypothetical protein
MNLPMRKSAADVHTAALTLAPLGVSLSIDVGRATDMSAVAEACSDWIGAPCAPAPRLALSVDTARHLSGTGDVDIAMRGSALKIRGPGVYAHAEPCLGRATGLVSSDYLANPQRLREDILEPLMLALVTRHDRAPVHASAFVAEGLAIVLAGPSGSGKSCLARAADAAGFQLLSDDVVYVQRSPRLAVWGWPRAAHLLPGDAGRGRWATRIRNGKAKRVVPLRSATAAAIRCERAVLCVLGRGNQPELSRISATEALRRLWPLDPGFDLLPDAIRAAVGALAGRGAWELRLSNEPDEAVRLVAENLPVLWETATS